MLTAVMRHLEAKAIDEALDLRAGALEVVCFTDVEHIEFDL